ncbi:MAG: oxidoreductase [Leeuwenhoekiella sp.]|uniref:aldo/keto reductase n=1 Tax=Leeuwenhoekiella palythoae TaxID=573501 RepID=UPI000C3ED36C|nr:aldo/keto reductase [Leeuwenhoekiella palythoae]MAS20082.1 oxidoreductase [Leeuwenhoekiella sp.]MBH11568.1 oxidoreductase [Leeuwenhoekiella sp.]UBZ10564.1 aldo/keto reductase [Leeuwenhoekiella palythoae]HAX15900.1 oxidoreductase [Leeuwenhoekiella sp.]|tara:strand:- start:1012 stop:1914 length:903 start_codon:yes stop_codon:yes gene_type:complete
MENRIALNDNLSLSRIVHGYWRLRDWNLSDDQLLKLIEQVLELGITSFDHADIYGNHTCEAYFGRALAKRPELREKMELISKCGIKMATDYNPELDIKIYDYSTEYIIKQAETSLKNLGTDRLDLLLLHRPAPFFNPEEVAKAFDQLKSSGKVLNFGVSNFSPAQFDTLQSYLDMPLATNQVEISVSCLEHFENENTEYFLKHKIKPMAWSPLAGGAIFNPKTEKDQRLTAVLKSIAGELNTDIDQVMYAWLLKHPTGIMPIVGSQHINRIKSAVDALEIELSLEQWYKIYIASKGEDLP